MAAVMLSSFLRLKPIYVALGADACLSETPQSATVVVGVACVPCLQLAAWTKSSAALLDLVTTKNCNADHGFPHDQVDRWP